ncbi:ATP-binding protein [Halalkalibacter akibai]|uniref:histidine kinase n=1 Tax=Halalkalibacter akibai (strain ATCC 43226 / DSM 21942 / CIP 109018 / JCM 9157 / 1139) TaxID=1236973 RepID=W4QWZ2_HALA3|nr:sensor histidine kinase [Halalkalibacter akibai]GAE36616.1 sensor kinase [Halalkalibacter akibai JCM 9157]
MDQFQTVDNEKLLNKPHVKLKLKMKMILLIGLLIISMFSVMGIFLHYFFSDTLETQLGERALSVATSVALIPELREAFALENPSDVIQPLVTPIKEATGAEFIVVGNASEIRYSHPLQEKIGQKMVGEDNQPALLHGESYVSKAFGSLGYSIRGKVPIFTEDGEIIGVVSVGYLIEDVKSMISTYSRELWFILFLFIGLGMVGAIFIARYIKRLLFGLEPEEISHLLLQKETILQSTHEGIIAVNRYGVITLINTAAQKLLFDHNDYDHFIGKPIKEILPASTLTDVLQTGESQFDKEVQIGKHTILVNRVPIFYGKTLIGAVSTFRNKTEIDRLTKELTKIKQYADALRAQTHEFSNKLYTILGLIQLEKKEEAVAFIKKENNMQQEWIHFLLEKVPDPMVNAILLGKLNQAMEQRVELSIHPDSQMTQPLSHEKRDILVTVLGNLLQNAIEATKLNEEKVKKITVFFTDIGNEILFEIEDSGPGIPVELADKIFTQGFSTKKGINRGIGLALTKQALLDVGGDIFLEEGDLDGACFVFTIPKDESKEG